MFQKILVSSDVKWVTWILVCVCVLGLCRSAGHFCTGLCCPHATCVWTPGLHLCPSSGLHHMVRSHLLLRCCEFSSNRHNSYSVVYSFVRCQCLSISPSISPVLPCHFICRWLYIRWLWLIIFLFCIPGQHVAVYPPCGASSHPGNGHGSGHLHPDGWDWGVQSGSWTDFRH